MSWSIKSFTELSKAELYAILKLRVDVFVVEQACAYPEIDDQDQAAIHILYEASGKLAAYARIVHEKGHWHIGRIVVAPSWRQRGLAREIMQRAEAYCWQELQVHEVHLSAQTYLEKFYTSLGYQTYSQPYDWDGIDHVDMKKVRT